MRVKTHTSDYGSNSSIYGLFGRFPNGTYLSPKTRYSPPLLAGEGWGEGENQRLCYSLLPPHPNLLPKGEGIFLHILLK